MNHELIAQKLEEIIDLLIEDAEDIPEESDPKKIQSILRKIRGAEDMEVKDIHDIQMVMSENGVQGEYTIKGCYTIPDVQQVSDSLRKPGGIKPKAETNRDRLVKGLKDAGFIEMDVDKFLKMLRDEETED